MDHEDMARTAQRALAASQAYEDQGMTFIAQHRDALMRITQHGPRSPEDMRLARQACGLCVAFQGLFGARDRLHHYLRGDT